MEKVLFSWSGGKDSSIALNKVLKGGEYEVVSLLTSVNKDHDRVSLHGVPRVLLEQQAASLGLPLHKMLIPKDCSEEQYDSINRETLSHFKAQGINKVVYADIFLDWVKGYREKNLAQIGMEAVFPIWGQETATLTRGFIDDGFKAVITCVDTRVMPTDFLGRVIDHDLLTELPDKVDPGGENGEFHSFVFNGPIFSKEIGYTLGKQVSKNSYHFCDLVPAES